MTTFCAAHKRIVSLLPSATEIVVALGAVSRLVGVSHECDLHAILPSSSEYNNLKLPIVTRTRLTLQTTPPAVNKAEEVEKNSNASSSSSSSSSLSASVEIDAQVRYAVENALSLYEIDVPLLSSLQPDVIITQNLCHVCAVSLDDLNDAVQRLMKAPHPLPTSSSFEIISVSPATLSDVFDDIQRIAAAIGCEEEGRHVRASLEQRIADIKCRVDKVVLPLNSSSSPSDFCSAPSSLIVRPRVVTIEWIKPLMIGGLWMSEMIEIAGGIPLATSRGKPALTLHSSQEMIDLQPDVILIKPCGYSLQQTEEEMPLIQETIVKVLDTPSTNSFPSSVASAVATSLSSTLSVSSCAIFVTDGNQFFNRSGPRLVESLEILVSCTLPANFANFALKHAQFVKRIR